MLSLNDFYILHGPLAEEVKRFLPLPATVTFAFWEADGSLSPLQTPLKGTSASAVDKASSLSSPRMADDQLVLPLDLPSGECVAVVINDLDPALLKKISASWLQEICATLVQRFELVHWGHVDLEVELYNRRALMVFLQEAVLPQPIFFLLLHTVFPRKTAAATLQKLREIADLLQVLTQSHCFSFGSGVFGVLLQGKSREKAIKTALSLQRQLRREGLSKAQIGFAQANGNGIQPPAKVFEKIWHSLAIAEKRGPFGFCDIDAFDERLPHPFQLTHTTLLAHFKKCCQGLSRFSLVMLSRQPSAGHLDPLADFFNKIPMDAGSYLGEEANLALLLLPEMDPETVDQHLLSIREKCREYYGNDQSVSLGVAFWPCLNFAKSDIPSNCLKALLHSSYLGQGATVVFDQVSLNVSGDFFFEEGDYRAAINDYRRGLRLQPGDLNLINSLGVALVECGQERQAAACFQEVLTKEPLNSMALVNLGHVQQALGRREAAMDSFEQAYQGLGQTSVASQDLLLPLGKLYTEFGEHAKSLAVFEQCRACPGSEKEFLLHRLLGQSYMENGQPKKAIKACQWALQLFPQDSISLSTLGLLYVEQGEGNDIGLTLCQKALTIDNFNPDHWFRLGRALLHVGDQGAARVAIRHCLQLRRNHVEGLLLSGQINLLEKKRKRAERCFVQAIGAKGCTSIQAERAQKFLATMAGS